MWVILHPKVIPGDTYNISCPVPSREVPDIIISYNINNTK